MTAACIQLLTAYQNLMIHIGNRQGYSNRYLYLVAALVVLTVYFAASVHFIDWDLPAEQAKLPHESTFVTISYILCYLYSQLFVICLFFLLGISFWMFRDTPLRFGAFFPFKIDFKPSQINGARTTYNRAESIECIICMVEFQSGDEILQLLCHEKHIYHYNCLNTWWLNANFTCPACRAPI